MLEVADGARRPDQLSVTEALDLYAQSCGEVAADALSAFWEGRTVADVSEDMCRRYVKSRVRYLSGGISVPVAPGTVCRELNALQAAISYCHAKGHLTIAVTVPLPAKQI